MKKHAKIIVVSLLLVFCFLTSCSPSRSVKSEKGELDVVGNVGEYEVLYEELRYITCKYLIQLENAYGKGIWEDEAKTAEHKKELYDLVTENIKANYAILSLCREVGITPDIDEIKKAVKEYMSSLVDELGGRSEYVKALKEEKLTDHFIRFSTSVDYCENELYYVYTQDLGLIETEDNKIYDYIMDGNFVRTLHVYIQNDEGDSVDENRRRANEVKAKLDAGTDIKTLIGSSYNEDFNLTTTDGYYFTKGEMITDYEDAAFSIGIGEISEVVETLNGFYIIQRLEVEPSYVMLHLNELKEQYQYSELNRYIDERQAELKFEFNDYGKTLLLEKFN